MSTLIGISGAKKLIARTRCKCWNCTHCAPRNRKRLIGKILGGHPDRILTLTSNPHTFETPEEAGRNLLESWRRMRQALVKSHGFKKIPFLAVWEKHKNGYPHLHIMLRGTYIKQAWASAFMGRRMNAPIVDIRKLRGSKHAAAYVAKYVTKDIQAPKFSKRYWSNRTYCVEKPERPWQEYSWSHMSQSYGLALLIHRASAYRITEQGPDHIIIDLTQPAHAPP